MSETDSKLLLSAQEKIEHEIFDVRTLKNRQNSRMLLVG